MITRTTTKPAAVDPGDAALARVLALPRREPATDELVEALSAALRVRPEDVSCTLRPAQAEFFRELWQHDGAFTPVAVGGGKTIPTLGAATIAHAERPVLLIPASLREKTQRDFVRYRKDWLVRLPELVSFEELGRPDREHLLTQLDPDLLIIDEAHHVRSTDSARTRRIDRFVKAKRAREKHFGELLNVACLSGTLMTENILDYHHIAVWCLGERAPLPTRKADAERWAAALDRDLGILHRAAPGALATIPGGYHEWFRGSRGVIPTSGTDCSASILMSIWEPTMSPELLRVLEEVARSNLRPDDELLDEWELPDCLSQLALGFWYRWDPAPPDWWLRPRRAWRAYAREVLDKLLDGFDSESQIVAALDREPTLVGALSAELAGLPPDADEGRDKLAAWRAVRDLFEPNTVPVWIDESVLAQAVEKVRKAPSPSLVWTRYRAAGFKLAELGVPYFPGGTDPESAKPGQSIALSISAHGTGRNLQHYHRALVLTPPANADAWEQMIGREHRAGQKSDTVYVEVIGSIDYHGATMAKVLSQARAITKASGFEHKLTIADWI